MKLRLDEKKAMREWLGAARLPGPLESFPVKGV